jgi:tetratricopeptide (TPR) repeat protein
LTQGHEIVKWIGSSGEARVRKEIWATILLAGALCGATSSRAQEVQNELQRARELETAEHFEQAIPIYLEVLKREPQNLEANLGLGRAYFHCGQPAQAAESFERALQLQPENTEIMEWLGKSYLRAREPQKVLELFGHEDSLASRYAWAHLLLAHAFDAQDKLDEARDELERALAIDPRCRGAHFALGFIAWTTRDLETAEREFRREVALDSRQGLPYYYLAETLEVQGKLEEAQTVLKRMAREAPNTYLYHFGAGKLDEHRGNFEAAAAEFREAIRLDPKQSEAHYHLALALRKLGETAQANQEFGLANQWRLDTRPGSGQGMGKMRPRLPDLE